MTELEWLGADNKVGQDIWRLKYQHKGESFEQWLTRVSGGDDRVADLIRNKRFLFGGRILANRGLTDRKITYSNCYVVSPPEDNLEDIYRCARDLARTYSYGGGCGTDVSKLAPNGAAINNAAKTTSGSVSFMRLFNLTTELIGQNGRRGALMLSLDCHHPDLEEFIDLKRNTSVINNANISVRITDDFMRAVVERKPFTLSFTRPETGEVIEKTVDAYTVFRRLCENNWASAEPGILFWDSIRRNNFLANDSRFEYAGTNPCLTGDTLISTTCGEIPIRDLVGTKPDVYCMDEDGNVSVRKAERVWKTRENADIVRVVTRRGDIRCTPDHLIHTRNRGWVKAIELRHGDRLTGLNRCMKDETHISVALSGGKYIAEHRLVAGYYYNVDGKDVHHIDGDTTNNDLTNLEVLEHSEHSRISNTGRRIESLRGKDGRYLAKPVKSKRYSFNLKGSIGTNWFVSRVEVLEEKEDVYDMTVPGVHNFVANRIVVHNCAEEPLPAGGSCLLGAMNLAEYVDDCGVFNEEQFMKDVALAVEALNDVLDEGLPLHPLKEQRDSVSKWRQIGLGIMGYGDMLIRMHLVYGSERALDVTEHIAALLLNAAADASSRLATDFGTYPMYDADCAYGGMYDHLHEYTEYSVRMNGLRNSQLLTIAPTGSISNMLGISGGIEPMFDRSYDMKTESLHGHEEHYKMYPAIVKQYMEENGCREDELPEWFITAKEIEYGDRILTQAVWQQYIDASISSTINLPKETTVDDVVELYTQAWRDGLKGCTIFRAGCDRASVLTSHEDKPAETGADALLRGDIVKASDSCIGRKRTLMTGCGTLHVEAFFDPSSRELREMYLSKGSTGGCNNYMIGLSRMISLAARAGVSYENIVDQLMSSGTCPSYAVRKATRSDTSPGSSCPVAVGIALKEMCEEMLGGAETEDPTLEVCPQCGKRTLVNSGGCRSCRSCSYSKCD